MAAGEKKLKPGDVDHPLSIRKFGDYSTKLQAWKDGLYRVSDQERRLVQVC